MDTNSNRDDWDKGKITEIDEIQALMELQISEWKYLKKISLINNQLTSLPPEVIEWKKVEMLNYF